MIMSAAQRYRANFPFLDRVTPRHTGPQCLEQSDDRLLYGTRTGRISSGIVRQEKNDKDVVFGRYPQTLDKDRREQ